MTDQQEQILEHYHSPHNFGKPEWNFTHKATLENLSCGDSVTFYLLIAENIIKNVTFEGEGCSISIAAASLLSDEIIDKSLDYILKLPDSFMRNLIDMDLSITRLKCSILSFETVKKAIISSK